MRKIWPFLIILACVLFLEVFVFNFSTWKTIGCEPVALADGVKTDENGIFSTEFVEISGEVKNVSVNLSVKNYDRAQVVVSLTDEGDFYAYDMPAYTVVPEAESSGYRNIYPYGKVGTIKVTVTVPAGTQADIQSIIVNAQRPLDFKVLRVLILAGAASLGYLFFTGHGVMYIPLKRGSKGQLLVTGAVVLGLMLLAWMIVSSNPICVNSPWPHHKQYQELAEAMSQGTVVIGGEPEAALVEKENPYDTIALEVEEIPYQMDYAYYNGHYYAYFGILPELLFFLPYYLITGKDLANYLVVWLLYCALAAGVFGTFRELALRLTDKISFVCYLLISVSVSLLSNYVFMLGRPDIYNIPIMAGNAFVFLGAFCWLRGRNLERRKPFWYGLGAFCIACIAGCRPQILLYGVALFAVLLLPAAWRKRQQWKNCINTILGVILPVLLMAAVVFWYNRARFGSGFEFGAAYSLTTNDMNHRGFNFSRLLRGLYSFLFQPPVINAAFPFLESCQLESDYMGKNMVEFCYGGFFVIFPPVLSLLYPLFGGWKRISREERGLMATLCVSSLIIAGFDINGAGILQRYMGDMVFGFVVAAGLAWMVLLGRSRERQGEPWLFRMMYCCTVFGFVFSFLVFITSGNVISLENYNPVLFYNVASYFRF